jgi:signal transduction histidine kinase
MNRIVSDLLTLSRMDEKGEAQRESAVSDLSEAIKETVNRLQAIAERQGITVNLPQTAEKIEVSANRELLEQALSNVIKNAIVYNKESGSVTIALQHEGGQAVISIADTGMGIPREDLDKIFDRFYRTDASRSRQTGGSGLGLAIVQSIMKQLKGSVHVESELGKGTTVTLRLPTSRAS